MVEAVFLVAAVAAVVCLFLAHPFRRGTIKPWLNVLAIVVFAIPGTITLVTATRPFFARMPFAEGQPFAKPTGAIVGPDAASAFLVRGFVFAEGGERRPIAAHWQVVRRGARFAFPLPDGSSIDARLSVGREQRIADVVPLLDCDWRGGPTFRSFDGPAVPAGTGFDGGDRPIYVATVDHLPLDAAPRGSLLGDRSDARYVAFYVTPLDSAQSIEQVDAAAWWALHADPLHERFVEDHALPSYASGAWGGGMSIGDGTVTFIGSMILFVSALLLLAGSVHWVRIGCLFLLLSCLYVGAVDRMVLRIHDNALALGDDDARAAAVVAIAGTRMHRIEAARRLIALAENPVEKPIVRETAIGMLATGSMAEAVVADEGADERLAGWRAGKDRALRTLADRIVERTTPPRPARPARADDR